MLSRGLFRLLLFLCKYIRLGSVSFCYFEALCTGLKFFCHFSFWFIPLPAAPDMKNPIQPLKLEDNLYMRFIMVISKGRTNWWYRTMITGKNSKMRLKRISGPEIVLRKTPWAKRAYKLAGLHPSTAQLLLWHLPMLITTPRPCLQYKKKMAFGEFISIK